MADLSHNDAYGDLNDLENDAVQIGKSPVFQESLLLHVTSSPEELVYIPIYTGIITVSGIDRYQF